MTTFGEYTRTIVRGGKVEAQETGSATIEAEHLLLAISSQRATVGQEVLASVGLNRDSIRATLRRELEQSLSAAGVYLGDFDVPPVSGSSARQANLGTSAKLAIQRALKFAPRQRLRPAHLLLGVLSAKVGTVPRALALAGVDQAELAEHARRAVAGVEEQR